MGEGLGRMFALIVVLFVLLIIVGCSCNTATLVATKSDSHTIWLNGSLEEWRTDNRLK